MSFHQKRNVGKSETVEVAILNVNSREYKFGDNHSILQNIILEGIAIHTAALGLATSGRTMLPDADLKKGLLTLASSTGVLINKVLPIETVVSNDNYITWFKPFKLDIAKSLVTLPSSGTLALPAGSPAGYAIMITLFYREFDAAKDKLNADGTVIE
jgi:hypothetical protein